MKLKIRKRIEKIQRKKKEVNKDKSKIIKI